MEERDINLLVAELGECHRLIDTMVKQTDRFQRLGTDLVSAFEQAKSVQLKLQTNVPKTKKLLAALTLVGEIHAEIKDKYLVEMGVKDVFAPDNPNRYDDGGAKGFVIFVIVKLLFVGDGAATPRFCRLGNGASTSACGCSFGEGAQPKLRGS